MHSIDLRVPPGAMTGCSATSPRTTAAIVSTSSAAQLSVSLELAARELGDAARINNTVELVLLGTGLSTADATSVQTLQRLDKVLAQGLNTSSVTVKHPKLVVGAHDLALLRIVPSLKYGEVCAMPSLVNGALLESDVDATIECIRRPPPIQHSNVLQLPLSWREHVRNLESFKWLHDLWEQTKRDAAREGAATPVDTNPVDVLTLCMYTKLASIALRTTDTALAVLRANVKAIPGAVDAGLLDVLGTDTTAAPGLLQFVEPYLANDNTPWRLSARGARAAAAAAGVLKRVYAHAVRVATVLQKAHIALVLSDGDGGVDRVVVADSGPHGIMPKLLSNRVPVSASSSDRMFSVTFKAVKADAWPYELNQAFHDVLSLLLDDPDVQRRANSLVVQLGAFTALSSPHLQVSEYGLDEDAAADAGAVLTRPRGLVAHVSRELTIDETSLHVDRLVACAEVQPGVSSACTLCTFCPTTAATLQTNNVDTTEFVEYDIAAAQANVEQIATSLDVPDAPLGLLKGTLGGVVTFNGESRRLAFWKRGADDYDSVVTLLPKRYVDISFADYMTGSRALDPDEFARPLAVPFFAADSVFTLFESSLVRGSNGLAFRLPSPNRLPLLGNDRLRLGEAQREALRAGAQPGTQLDVPVAGALSMLVRESGEDQLTGLLVEWSRKEVNAGGSLLSQMTFLVARNGSNELVSY